jgi:hypothetical protein
MHFHIGLAEFLVWLLYYVIAKALLQILNIETRRHGWHVPAAVSGLYS